MAETVDDLSAPLGQEVARRSRRFRLPFTGTQALAASLGLFLLVFVGFAVFNDDPLGGEPVAHVALGPAGGGKVEGKPAASPSEQVAKAGAKQGGATDQKTVTIIDGSSGARQNVVISGEAPDKADSNAADVAPAAMAGIDQRLLEKSRYGMIPVVADGLKPFTLYAADADREDEGLPAVDRAVELRALLAVLVEPARVVHDAALAGLRGRARAHDGVFVLESGGSLGGCHGAEPNSRRPILPPPSAPCSRLPPRPVDVACPGAMKCRVFDVFWIS